MKKVNLLKLSILNFKGIENLSVDFGKSTDIFGANESGKTSIWDAFNWLVTGKESNNSERFPLKRLDKKGNPIENIDVSVEGSFEVVDSDGVVSELLIKREFVEMWGASKRGASDNVFKGNTTKYYWNNAPLDTETEFLGRVSDVFGTNDIFKILTNPAFFSSDAFDWKKRRAILESLAGGELTDDVILLDNPKLESLIKMLETKSLKDVKSEASNNKKLLKEEQGKIKTRIEEAKLSKVDPVDEVEIRGKIDTIRDEIEKIDIQISDIAKKAEAENEKRVDMQKKIWELESENATMYNAAKAAYNTELSESTNVVDTLNTKVDYLGDQLRSLESRANDGRKYIDNINDQNESILNDIKRELKIKEDKMSSLRNDFSELSKRVFTIDEKDGVCQLCNRPHDPDHMAEHSAEMLSKFNADIADKKKKINESGLYQKNQAESLKKDIIRIEAEHAEKHEKCLQEVATIDEDIAAKKVEISELNKQIENAKSGVKIDIPSIESRLPEKYNVNLESINILKSDLSAPNKDAGNYALMEEKRNLTDQLGPLNIELSKNDNNKKVDDRVKFLQDQFQEIGIKLSEQDNIIFDTEKYEQFKFEELERRVNTRFKMVQFKMFNRLQNGGYEPTCLATYNGVPYVKGGLNTAARMTSGIDIVQTLSEHFALSLPLFLDNRESCSVIPETDLQVVNLFVSAEDKKIRTVK